MPTPEEVADFVVRQAKEKPHVRRVVEDVKLFDGLKEHAGWRRLAERIRADRDRFLASLSLRLMNGEVVSQREIDYKRGFYAGAEYVIETPAEAEASLEAAAREAWALTRLELAHQDEESSPYLD